MKVKKGDKVVILTGQDKGKTGEVTSVMPELNRVVVDGINVRTKHLKPSANRQQGSLERRPEPIHASNVALIAPGSKNKPTRVGITLKNQKKLRIAKANKKEIK